MLKTFFLLDPCDFHSHFRNGDMMRAVLTYMVQAFVYILGMPNTDPPLLTGDDACEYDAELRRVHREDLVVCDLEFEPLVSIQITPETTPKMIYQAATRGVRSGKLYPRNVTSFSHFGITDYRAVRLLSVFAAMEKCGMIAQFHPEHPDPSVEGMLKEQAFIAVLKWIREHFPQLKIVVEHVTSEVMINWVKQQDPHYVRATLAVHYMLIDHGHVNGYEAEYGNKGRADLMCKPCPKLRHDRQAILEAALSGDPHFFYGGDNAPHPRHAKHIEIACGVYNGPVALQTLVELFETAGKLERLQDFVSTFGREFYNVPGVGRQVTLVREPWVVPSIYPGDVVPFRNGQTIQWQIIS